MILVVEPHWHGHRFSYVRYIVDHTSADVVLLTSRGASSSPEFAEQLAGTRVEVVEAMDEPTPPAGPIVAAVDAICVARPVDLVVVMDADHPLKSWWRVAGRRGRSSRPPVSFLLTRYPQRWTWREPRQVARRAVMAILVALARANGSLASTAALSPRGSTTSGRLVRRVADPAISTAHARDRDSFRARHGLPLDACIIGVFGVLTLDKNIPLLLEAAERCGGQLLLAGKAEADVVDWLAKPAVQGSGRLLVREGYLPERDLDELVAAVDVVAVVMNYDRPSAIMGKALATGVPVISAASKVREQELAVTRGGVSVDLSVEGVLQGLEAVTDGDFASSEASARSAGPADLVAVLVSPSRHAHA